MLLSLFFLFLWVVLALGVIRYAAYYLSNWAADELDAIQEETGPLSVPVLRGLSTAVMADVMAVFNSLFLFRPEPPPGNEGPPVVLVHGLYHNRTAWRTMRKRLAKAGYTNLHTYQYNSYTKDFEPAVHGLLRKLDSLLGATDTKVILIGHSLGGLVCRSAAGNPQYRDRIAGLVTLGSPHKGSDLARIGVNRMARDLIPGSHIPQAVDRLPDPDCLRLGIFSLMDDYVFPQSLLRTGRPGWEEKTCSNMSHVWMLYSREVADMVIAFLRKTSSSG